LFGVGYHQYADDTQLYTAISKVNVELQLATFEMCISSIHQWLLNNGLSFNPSKSEAIQFVTGRERSGALDKATVNVSGVVIQPAGPSRASEIVLDHRLSMDQHINHM
jgi:hypothetical protein